MRSAYGLNIIVFLWILLEYVYNIAEDIALSRWLIFQRNSGVFLPNPPQRHPQTLNKSTICHVYDGSCHEGNK